MADPSILKALQIVASTGGRFLFSIEAPFGAREAFATAEQAAAIAAGELHASALLGLTPSEYYDWIEWGGRVQCSAHTGAGTRCRNTVAGTADDVPARWKLLYDQQPHCRVHGGE